MRVSSRNALRDSVLQWANVQVVNARVVVLVVECLVVASVVACLAVAWVAPEALMVPGDQEVPVAASLQQKKLPIFFLIK